MERRDSKMDGRTDGQTDGNIRRTEGRREGEGKDVACNHPASLKLGTRFMAKLSSQTLI